MRIVLYGGILSFIPNNRVKQDNLHFQVILMATERKANTMRAENFGFSIANFVYAPLKAETVTTKHTNGCNCRVPDMFCR